MNNSLEFSVDVFELSELELTSAASAGNYALIKKWVETIWSSSSSSSRQESDGSREDLRNLARSAGSRGVKRCPTSAMRNAVGKMIRAAALDGEVAIVDLLRSYAYLNENAEEMNNWTVLHCAVMGITRYSHLMQSAQDRFIGNLSPAQDNQLQIIYLLYEAGANVTIESSPSVTPFVMALELCPTVNFWIGAVLLEKLQKMQKKGIPPRIKEIPMSIYEDCIQTLVQWATVGQYTTLAMQILKDPDFNQDLMERCLKLDSNKAGYTLFHVVADNGNAEFMQQLINASSLTPEIITNMRYARFLPENSAVEMNNQEMVQTPLSLAIGRNHVGIINTIHRANEALCTLTYINLNNVSIRTVPKEIFAFSSLKVLDLSNNKLKDLPLSNDFVNNINIVELDLSENRFKSLPDLVFSLPMLESLSVISNTVEMVPANWWRGPKLQKLDLSSNQIAAIGMEPTCDVDLLLDVNSVTPPSVYTPAFSHIEFRLRQKTTLHSDTSNHIIGQSPLTVLRLNNNLLKSFPRGLACVTPKLESLHLVNNRITDICSIEELPPKLRNLDVSCNFIASKNLTIFHLADSPLPCFRASSHSTTFCNHMSHKNLCSLGNLNFCHNELKQLSLFDQDHKLFFPKLFSLNLGYNQFTELPMELYRFTELKLLTISNNPGVVQIPRDIGYINGLIEFEYNNVADPLVGTLNGIPTIPDKLTYLRSMEQSSEKNSMLKLMIVGPSGHGKSTLLAHLKSKCKIISQPVTFFDRYASYSASSGSALPPLPQTPLAIKERNSTVGIDIAEFINDGGNVDSQKITFVAMDFAGQEEYFITHHCFITPGAIYAVCCKAKELFESGVSILLPWLAMIKAKAPDSPVLIVGTFCDRLPSKMLKQCDELRRHIMAQFSISSASLLVEIKDVVFVECVKRRQPCIAHLKQRLYELAFTVTIPPTDSRQKFNHQKLLHQLVPIAYMEFQQCILAKAAQIRRHLNEQQPVYSWAQLQEVASGIISDEKELRCAVEHMKRNGTLIHFDAEGLQQFYFIDPQWLIDKLALVVSTPNISILSDFTGQQHPEIVNTRSLMRYLSNNLLSPAFQDAFCKLLFRFELAIPIDESRLFFPSLLWTHSEFHYFRLHYSFPRNVDLDVLTSELIIRDTYCSAQIAIKRSLSAPRNVTLQPTGLCYRRFFVLTVVPVPLWPRLISWCIAGSKFFEIIRKNCLSTLPFQSLQDFGKTRVGNSILEWMYWKNGIELRLSGMTLLQISSVDLTGCNKEAEDAGLHTYVKDIYINSGNQWIQLPLAYTGGIEVNVPECVLFSIGDSPDQYKISSLMSAQIFTHCIEVIDEIFMEWFTTANTGGTMRAISKYLISFTPCPICVGDEDKRAYVDGKSPVQSCSVNEMSMQHSSQSTSHLLNINSNYSTASATNTVFHNNKEARHPLFDSDQPKIVAKVNKLGFRYIDSSDLIGDNPVGFTTMHCLWIAQHQDFVHCPRHGTLKLKYFAPDLVYADVQDFIISKTRLLSESEQAIKQGGFGKVVMQKLISEHDQSVFTIVATKILGKCDIQNPDNTLQQYCDNRRELNMIYGLKHPRIVKFYGITVHPVGFVMEWAGMGSLDDIIKQHQLQRQYICPDSVYTITLQVVTGLQYLHKNHIVHFDIKPQNILIFNFPRESHCCYSQNDASEVTCLRCIHCSKEGELDGVVTKIADLGISVRKGPRGFVRKVASPGHTAPEALLHRGLEQLSEKADMFPWGMCMYETISCTLVPPKQYSIFEFDEEIKNGIRPGFLENDPKYPALLYDCMTSCWDQDPRVRPSATQLLDTLSTTKLQLIDFFVFNDYKISNIQCSCKIFIEESGKEFLWLAVNEQSGGSCILVIEFQVHGSKVVPQVTQPLCFTEKVLKICQLQQFVYLVLEGAKVVTVNSQIHEQLNVDHNPFSNTNTANPCAVCCIQDMNLLLVALTSGDIGIVSFPQNQFDSLEIDSSFEYEIISSIGRRSTRLCSLGIESHFLCIEVVTIDENNIDIWCGCNNNTIAVLSLQSLSTEETPKITQIIRNVSGSAHVSCKVLQLKTVNLLNLQLVCALLDIGVVVCYDAGLKDCLKRMPAPTATVMLPCNNKLYLGTKSGQILSLNINSIITDETTNEKPLECGKHSIDQPVFDLLTVTGELSPHSFLEGFGSVHCKPNNKPCKVMLSIGGGYTEFFSCSEPAITVAPNDLCIISFRV